MQIHLITLAKGEDLIDLLFQLLELSKQEPPKQLQLPSVQISKKAFDQDAGRSSGVVSLSHSLPPSLL